MTTTWHQRIWQEFHAGQLTGGHRDVLLTLRTFRGHGGRAWPAHETLAARARCCVRTVQRALAAAQRLGLVAWSERRVRVGWRWLRTSNLYRFLLPETPVLPRARTTGQNVGEGESKKKKGLANSTANPATWLEAAQRLPDLLALRRKYWQLPV